MPGRLYPYADIRLYDAGAEGYCSDVGQTVYDIIAESVSGAAISAVTVDNRERETLLYIEAVRALVCRPRRVAVDMALAQFHLSGSYIDGNGNPRTDVNWKLSRVSAGHNKQFLLMHQPSKSFGAIAETVWSYPPGAPISFNLFVQSALRAEYDANRKMPYVQIWFGALEFCFVLNAEGDCWAYRLGDDAAYVKVAELRPESYKFGLQGKTDFEELPFDILEHCGQVLLTCDSGKTFVSLGAGTLAGGPLVVQWYGLNGGLAIYQVVHDEGTYEPELLPLFEDRSGQIPDKHLVPGFHYEEPVGFVPGTDTPYVDVAQLTTWPGHGDKFAYRATLTPKDFPAGAAPFPFSTSPSLSAVEFDYPVALVAPDPSAHVHLTDYGVLEIGAELPDSLDAATATIRLMLDPRAVLTGEYRRRYVEIDLGMVYTDFSWDLTPVVAGYIVSARAKGEPEWRSGHSLEFQIIDASIVGRSGGTVDESWPPFDGWEPNDALAFAAAKLGVAAARCSWGSDLGPAGQQLYLSCGPADNPVWWRTGDLPLEMPAWDAMILIAAALGYDLFIAPDGTWVTRYRAYATGTSVTFDAAGSYPWTATGLEYEAATIEGGTAAMACGEDANGRVVAAWYIDFPKERIPATALFAGRRFWKRSSGRRYYNVADAMAAAAVAFEMQAEDQYNLFWTSPLQVGVARNDVAYLVNAEGDGLNPIAGHCMQSIRHQVRPRLEGTESTFNARRL